MQRVLPVRPFHVSDEQHAESGLAIPEFGRASRADCVTAPAATPHVRQIYDLCHGPSPHLTPNTANASGSL